MSATLQADRTTYRSTYRPPEKVEIATATGSSYDTVKELIGIFAEALSLPVEFQTISSETQAKSVGFNRLILLGGGDISPTLYGESNTHSTGIIAHRDAIEWELAKRARDHEVPTLGICRGHQMIAAAHGGTLYQDFAKQYGGNHGYYHRLIEIDDPLGRFLPTDRVNSLHHQSVRRVPEGFRVMAKATDGVIESIYKPGVLGVQWHPEMMIEHDEEWLPLFAWWLLDGLREDV